LATQENQNPPRAHFHAHPHHAALTLTPREQGESRVSASWLACALTLDRWVLKWAPFFTLFWTPSCATASSRSCGSDRQILKAVETPGAPCSQFDTTRAFPLPFAPSPSSNGRLQPSWRNEKSRLRSYSLEPNPGYKRGAHREKDSARDDRKHNKKTKTNQSVVLDRYVL
jgi:hypothetical protein